MSESVDREVTIRNLLDEAHHHSDAPKHCVVEVEPGQFVVTRTRAQAEFLRGALAVLRAQAVKPAPATEPPAQPPAQPPAPPEQPAVEDEAPEPAAPVKRGPGRPRKAVTPE